MHQEIFKKLWSINLGGLPYLDSHGYDRICEISRELSCSDSIRFWGLVREGLRYRGHPVLRCFNFGNLMVDYPWQVQLVNFGHEIPATIVRSGTVSSSSEPRRLLDNIAKPYLAFCYESDGQLSEHLEPGMLITPAEVGNCQRTTYDVVLPAGVDPPVHDGMLYYFMLRRLPFKVEVLDRWVSPGAPFGLPRFRMFLQLPVCLDVGWPVLLLEKNRWMWGVISS